MSRLGADVAISVDGLGKRYRIGVAEERDETLAAAIGRRMAAPLQNFRRLRSLRRFEDAEGGDDVIWALRDISFEVAKGEALGIVGRNGAGKSTLLKVLARITHPTTGSVRLRGRLASLLEVGTGFHPDLTGRENVFLNGAMLGMTRREVQARFDEIVEFADMATFMDTPVKRYSTGMYLRLGFAVAAHLEPDILLADEVLAVGDAEFQQRCLGKMREAAGGGRTVLFVSHNRAAVSSLCTRAIWLDGGVLRADGAVEDVLAAYADSVRSLHGSDLASRVDRGGDGRIRFTSVQLRDAAGDPARTFAAGEPFEIVLGYESADGRPVRGASIRLHIDTAVGERVATVDTMYSGEELGTLPPTGYVVCRIASLLLTDGDYVLTLKGKVRGRHADLVEAATAFRVDATGYYPTRRFPKFGSGAVLLSYGWEVTAESLSSLGSKPVA
jgi:lipopolysaccharide transport system ATP-binding protein